MVEGFRYFPYNDIAAFEALLASCEAEGPRVAAVLLEPLQGEGGVHPGDPAFFRRVRELCDERSILLILDEVQVRACNLYSKLDLPETPLLLLEFHGTEAWVGEQSTRFGEIAADLGGGPFTWTTRPEERTKLWAARHDAYWAGLALRPGCQTFSTDVCVPISRLAECIAATKEDIAASGLLAPIVGHVGDGNFHLTIIVDRDDPAEVEAAEALHDRLVHRAIAMEGTCSGEHGVGSGKVRFLHDEHDAETMAMMRRIKDAMDPLGLMNPGKVLG